jgi:hypothetical protein
MTAANSEDATQGFFEYLLTHELMAEARRERGRFRSFLLGCLKHFLGNEWQKRQAQRRGGHLAAVHLDALEAEERYRLEVEALSTSDDEVFDQSWAHGMLDRAMRQLRAEQRDEAHFDLLAPALTGSEDRAALMQATGMNESALKVTIHSLRKRFRELLGGIMSGIFILGLNLKLLKDRQYARDHASRPAELYEMVEKLQVLLQQREGDGPSSQRRDCSRPGRLRWLQSVTDPAGQVWDAWQAPAGSPLCSMRHKRMARCRSRSRWIESGSLQTGSPFCSINLGQVQQRMGSQHPILRNCYII